MINNVINTYINIIIIIITYLSLEIYIIVM